MYNNSSIADNSQFDNEEWRPIQGYEGLYEVSNLGRVRRVVPMRRGTQPAFGLLKHGINTSGYACISLCYPRQKGNPKMIHRLMAIAFLAKPSDAHTQVNHIDGNRLNNRLDNLEWVTPSQNTWHSIQVLGNLQSGEHNPQAKLTEADVVEIRRLYATGNYYHHEIAPMFGVTGGTIAKIVNRQLWGHVE